jgi:N6-adenosine-specific RNA methylase IME4
MFDDLPKQHFGAILADPPWRYRTWNQQEAIPKHRGTSVSAACHFRTMPAEEIAAMPVGDLVAQDAVLFLWMTWPQLLDALSIIEAWGFQYKTCGFSWIKAHAGQIEMFQDDFHSQQGMGYWTRSNSEICLLATRGQPKRLDASVRQAIIEPRREHSRKPDCVRERIERLVGGPYLDLFSRTDRKNWVCWGDERGRFGYDKTHMAVQDSAHSSER